MARYMLTIRELGEEVSWMLVHQAMGMPDAKMQSDFMVDKVALFLFTRQSLPERLCVTAAVRQMGGSTIYAGDQGGLWRQEIHAFQEQLLPILAYYLDCMYVYGFPVAHWHTQVKNLHFPVINAGSPDAHPAHALADIACMLRKSRYLKGVETAWIGCVNGTLLSLVEATRWFPFAMRIAVPPDTDRRGLDEMLAGLKTPVELVSTAEEAIRGVKYVFAGYRGELDDDHLRKWRITPGLLAKARPDARLLLSASPIRAIPIDEEVFAGGVSLLTRQAEYRMRVHKRILHWVFG